VEPLFSLCILSQSHRNNREGSAGILSPLGGGGEGGGGGLHAACMYLLWNNLGQYMVLLVIYGFEVAKNLK
jgi:hypothetical protein